MPEGEAIESHLVERAGSTLHVTVGGDGEPLLYLHGLTSFGRVARLEAPGGFRLATYDQRGHGSGTPFVDTDAYAIDEFVADALSVLDALGWRRAAVGGTSMGAAVALRLALDAPDRVDKLLLAGPPFGDVDNPEGRERIEQMADVLDDFEPAAAIAALKAGMLEQGMPVEVTTAIDPWIEHDLAALVVAMRSVSAWRPFANLEIIRTIAAPVFVVGWPDDPIHPLELAERMVSLTGGRLELLSGVAEVLAHPESVGRAFEKAFSKPDHGWTADAPSV